MVNPTVELSNFRPIPPISYAFVDPAVVIRTYFCPTLSAKNALVLPGVDFQI